MTYDLQDYIRMVQKVENSELIQFESDVILDAHYEGELVAKERARKGKNGTMFTPKRTADFEKKIKQWGKLQMQGSSPVKVPVAVELEVLDNTDDLDLVRFCACGMIYKMKGDLDNYEKSILDGLNKVVWADDKQITSMAVQRRYSTLGSGFSIRVVRNGLSPTEFENFMKVWRNRERYRAKSAD